MQKKLRLLERIEKIGHRYDQRDKRLSQMHTEALPARPRPLYKRMEEQRSLQVLSSDLLTLSKRERQLKSRQDMLEIPNHEKEYLRFKKEIGGSPPKTQTRLLLVKPPKKPKIQYVATVSQTPKSLP